MIEEPNAITCRVVPSFVRIGNLDLFARRATKNVVAENTKPNANTIEFKELEDLVLHACFREFPATRYEPFREKIIVWTVFQPWLQVGLGLGSHKGDFEVILFLIWKPYCYNLLLT